MIYENGVEVSRERVNKSTYQMSPQYVTVGTASADPNAVAAINGAIASGDLNAVKSVAAAYSGADADDSDLHIAAGAFPPGITCFCYRICRCRNRAADRAEQCRKCRPCALDAAP